MKRRKQLPAPSAHHGDYGNAIYPGGRPNKIVVVAPPVAGPAASGEGTGAGGSGGAFEAFDLGEQSPHWADDYLQS